MSASGFGALPLEARSHLQVRVHGAVLLVVDLLRATGRRRDLAQVLARHPFLGGYLDAAMPHLPADLPWEQVHAWWESAVAEWEEPGLDALPLGRLGAVQHGGPGVAVPLVLAGLVDADSRFGSAFAELGGSRRPTIELLAQLGRPVAPADGPDPVGVVSRLVDDGVLLATPTDGPRGEWTVAVLPELWTALHGEAPRGVVHAPAAAAADLGDLVTTEELRARCVGVAAGLADIDLVVLRGTSGSDRLAVAAAMARAAGRGTLTLSGATAAADLARLGPVATALDAVPVVELDPRPGEAVRLERRGYAGPIVAVLATTGGVETAEHDRHVALEVPRLDAALRARRWARALEGADDVSCEDVEALATACGLQGRHIDQVARAAIGLARVEGAPSLALEHVRSAAGQLHRRLLDDLAARLETAGDWDDVVVGDFTAARLAELETRCRHRERIGESLPAAYARGTGVGVRALFTGASGTGKTLAATVLGHRLGLDVHRLDLSAVVDKYVGETEKNLHRVLSAAEELDVVLLVDEGDALLGRRTDVRTANDRFANQETNFLLQRLEHYRGIVVITTNAPDHVDAAFQRRMDVTVGFLPPSPRERVAIWHLHLPGDHRVSDGLVHDLAHRCAMTGGQIRNAVLHAVLLAVQDDRPVGDRHVERAVLSEYQKAGASSPYDPSGRRHPVSRAQVFHEAFS